MDSFSFFSCSSSFFVFIHTNYNLKLVLGTPWYGYHYPCLEGTTITDRYCPIQSVPFRGVNCSDAAGNELDYAQIRNLYYNITQSESDSGDGKNKSHSNGSSSSSFVSMVKRDVNMNAPWFNERKSSKLSSNDVSKNVFENEKIMISQYWYDDSISLRYKYSWSKKYGLGGVGPYCLNMLAALKNEEEKIEMWSTLDEFAVV